MIEILKVKALQIKFSIHCMRIYIYIKKLTFNLHIIQCTGEGRGAKKIFPSK